MAAEEIERMYKLISRGGGETYTQLFAMQGFFAGCMEFDPVTNEPLQTTVDDVLRSVSRAELLPAWWNDRLQRIIDFSSAAIYALLDFLHEKNLREHRTSRPERVREIDSRCMMWLAKKPGFTIKQKIASEQRMMGVYHTTSIDMAENRLLKAFLLKLDDILFEKEKAAKSQGFAIPEEMRRLISTIHSWTYSDEYAQIAPWNNVPPNNTLLNDKNYRKIWKAWLALQKLAEQIEADKNRLPALKARALLLLTAARLNQNAYIRFRQTVLFPKYEELTFADTRGQCAFAGWCKNGAQNAAWQKITVSWGNDSVVLNSGEGQIAYSALEYGSTLSEISAFSARIAAKLFPRLSFESIPENETAICAVASVDLNAVRPSFARSDGKTVVQSGIFAEKLLFQSQQQEKQPLFYSCARSKYIWSKLKALKTLSLRNIFDRTLLRDSDSENTLPIVEKACADFARVIKTQLHSQNCVYITSDDIDDFSPSVNAFKRSMNVAFVRTEILPRSIAAVFSRLDDIKARLKDGDKITVRDSYDGYEIVTELKIAVDDDLRKENPETNGFIFQRLSHHRRDKENPLPAPVPKNLEGILSSRDAELLDGAFSADDFHFENAKQGKAAKEKSESQYEIVITAHDDTSLGAITYRRLQNLTPDIYLWCDFLPKLSMVDASGTEYVLVEPDKVSVHPVVGKPVSINIPWKFSFPAKKAFYEFPLMQGEKKEKSDYFAFIKDSSFPLEHETECHLHLTYTYGKDYPYSLEFIPVADGAEFRTVTVKWENKSHRDFIHDMPVPNFVREYTWADMRAVPKRDTEETSDIPGIWLPMVYDKIRNAGIYKVSRQLNSQIEGKNVFLVNKICPDGRNPICYVNEEQGISVGDRVWCCIVKGRGVSGGYKALDALRIGIQHTSCSFEKSIRYPAIIVWNNGKSIFDRDCSQNFRNETLDVLEFVKNSLTSETPEIIKHELMFFLSCLHRDMPDWFSSFLPKILSVVDKDYDYPKFIAYALGDCSQDWQKDLLEKTLALLDDEAKSVYAVKILAKALWRVNGFAFTLTESNAEKMLSVVNTLLSSKRENQQETVAVRSACLECLVALCRLRHTKDDEPSSEQMQSILSAERNAVVKQIIAKLERMKKSNAAVKTFLTFEIDRPADDRSPELLYAAHGYLSGQIEGNAIRVLEVDFGE